MTRIDAKELKTRLHDGAEIALLDAREELPFGWRHLLKRIAWLYNRTR